MNSYFTSSYLLLQNKYICIKAIPLHCSFSKTSSHMIFCIKAHKTDLSFETEVLLHVSCTAPFITVSSPPQNVCRSYRSFPKKGLESCVDYNWQFSCFSQWTNCTLTFYPPPQEFCESSVKSNENLL